MMGLEPTTFGTTIRRSNQLSYTHRFRAGKDTYFFPFQANEFFKIIYSAGQRERKPAEGETDRRKILTLSV